MPQTSSLNELTREVRLGIVLYGGVSLAVYENGVAQELFRAVKGAGIYTVIKQLTGCDVVLDIISGTSAGGINGILLGYALANDCDPSVTKDFWREEGDILNLLHAPGDPAPNSILNSRGYYQPRLELAYAAIKNQAYQPPPEDLVSPIAELDVFITGTNAYGHVYTEFDDFGHAIDVKDHRALFHLRKRIENDFTHSAEVYAKLSRITSCFPVAFEPVEVNSESGDLADRLLINWGSLAQEKDSKGREKSSFFLDGGILNNKPFSSTLSAIFHHTQTREVERFLLYVEPDPEQFSKRLKEFQPAAPNVVQAAGEGLSSIPSYQSIAADLAAIAEHNSRARRYQELVQALNRTSADLMEHSSRPMEAPAGLKDLDAKAEQPRSPTEQTNTEELTTVYLRSRISRARDRVVDGVLKENGHRRLLQDAERQAGELLVKAFDHLHEDQVLKSLHEFDVYYRMRRLFFVADRISERINDSHTNLSNDAKEAYRDVWRRINHRIKCQEIIRSKIEELIDLADFRWQEIMKGGTPAAGAARIWAAVESLLGRLLAPAGPSQDAAAAEDESGQGELYRLLDDRVRDLVKSFDPLSVQPEPASGLPDNLLICGDADELALLKQYTPGQLKDPITQHYCRFIYVDSFLFPMQYMSEMESTDEVKTMRISPIDAHLGFSSDPRKLCGNQLSHFGGFLKSSWRANDLMWGRLDGACQLMQCVVTRERLRKLIPADQKLLVAALRARCPAGAEYMAELEKELENFTNAADGSAPEKDAFDKFLSALIYVGQSEILQQEVPRVVEASIAQQGVWNQYDLNNLLSQQAELDASGSPPAPNWRAGARQPDRTVTSYAAVRFAQESSRDWVRYFRDEYTVSEEQWQNGIPRSVLIEIITTMILVLRKSLLEIGENGPAVRGSMIFRVTSFPLRIAYYLTRIQRLAPEYLRVAVFGGFVFCFSVLGVYAYSWWRLGAKASLILLVVPLTILLVLGAVVYLMYRGYRPSAKRRENVASLSKEFPQVSA
jgi:patatin-related protein